VGSDRLQNGLRCKDRLLRLQGENGCNSHLSLSLSLSFWQCQLSTPENRNSGTAFFFFSQTIINYVSILFKLQNLFNAESIFFLQKRQKFSTN
jgi:hypothetical protein